MKAILWLLLAIFVLKIISFGIASENITTVNIPVEYGQTEIPVYQK